MKKFAAGFLLILCLALPVFGQDGITLSGIKKVVVEKLLPIEPGQIVTQGDFPVTATGPQGGFGYSWDYPETLKAKRKGSKLEIVSAPKGTHELTVTYTVVDFEKKRTDEFSVTRTLLVGDGPTPIPPKPDPDPDPPKPDPPIPVPTGGLTVLISYESAMKAKLPSTQAAIITSVPVRQYLIAKCVADPSPVATDGKAYRIWDDDETGSLDTKLWQDIVKIRPPVGDLAPRIFISNGKETYEDLLPLTPDATISLLKKYGGE